MSKLTLAAYICTPVWVGVSIWGVMGRVPTVIAIIGLLAAAGFMASILFGIWSYRRRREPGDLHRISFLGLLGLAGLIPGVSTGLFGLFGLFGFAGCRGR